jgi:hypothetical protein
MSASAATFVSDCLWVDENLYSFYPAQKKSAVLRWNILPASFD